MIDVGTKMNALLYQGETIWAYSLVQKLASKLSLKAQRPVFVCSSWLELLTFFNSKINFQCVRIISLGPETFVRRKNQHRLTTLWSSFLPIHSSIYSANCRNTLIWISFQFLDDFTEKKLVSLAHFFSIAQVCVSWMELLFWNEVWWYKKYRCAKELCSQLLYIVVLAFWLNQSDYDPSRLRFTIHNGWHFLNFWRTEAKIKMD